MYIESLLKLRYTFFEEQGHIGVGGRGGQGLPSPGTHTHFFGLI